MAERPREIDRRF